MSNRKALPIFMNGTLRCHTQPYRVDTETARKYAACRTLSKWSSYLSFRPVAAVCAALCEDPVEDSCWDDDSDRRDGSSCMTAGDSAD